MKQQILLSVFCLSVGCVLAQDTQERPFRSYSTQSVHKRLISEFPEFTPNIQTIESQIGLYGAAGDLRQDTIALVFHILYSPGQQHPDELAILAQIAALNADYQAYNPSLEPFVFAKIQEMAARAISPGTFFCLPVYGVDGASISPIRFVQTPTEIWKADDALKSADGGGADPLDTKRYLNIWVAELDDYSSGYAQMPGGPDNTDGIVIDPSFFGVSEATASPYNKGKTLTHLIGSYLGLHELWNETVPCGDDKVDDTPIHNAPNYGLGTHYHHVSLCDSTLSAEMVINFMDNTDDEALVMFTQGQKNRMKSVLSPLGSRAELVSWNHSCLPAVHFSPDTRNEKSAAADLNHAPNFSLFPNPAKGTINLEISMAQSGTVTFSAFNVLGELIMTTRHSMVTGNQIFSQNCDGWSPGMYFIRAGFEDGSTITRSVFLERP